MRTTLKRGIGRGAGVNGNGRAVLPPATTTPMTLYRQPERRRRTGLQLVGRILLWLLIAALVVAAGLLGGAYLYFHEQVKAVQAHTPDVIRAEKGLDVPQAGKPATALIVGYDHRAGRESGVPSRSDTIMLVRADPIDKTVSMMSLPRDLLVPIYCRAGQPVTTDRINSAYERCGTRGTLETVKALTGLSVNYLITVNFRGFKQVVDKLGGVWVDVDRRYFNDNAGLTTGYNTYATINLQPGYQRLNGSDALDFVRYRHTDSDLYRVARQQAFVKAFKEQVSSSFSLKKIPKLVHAITSNVEVGQSGNQKISGKTILSYAFFLYDLPSGHFFQPKLENLQQAGPFNAELAAPQGAVAQAVQQFSNPDVEAAGKATARALGTKFRSHALKPSRISLVVLNGNGRPGSAANASFELAKRHFRVVVPPDPQDRNVRPDYKHTIVFYDPHKKLGLSGARRVAALFSDAVIAEIPPSLRSHQFRAMLIVVVGASFDGTFAESRSEQLPKKEPPAVYSNPGASVPLVRSVRRKVPFRLEYPLLLEKTSSPSTLEPVRAYTIAKGHKAVRLVYSMNTVGDYWGIEETDWTDAPVLQEPNFKHRIKGREFAFYYSGPNLHMIVLRERGATYWVTNTLLDKLSNETMLAIAKSLRPLGK